MRWILLTSLTSGDCATEFFDSREEADEALEEFAQENGLAPLFRAADNYDAASRPVSRFGVCAAVVPATVMEDVS